MNRRGFFKLAAAAVGAAFIPLRCLKRKPWERGYFISEFKYYIRPMEPGFRSIIFHRRDFT